MIIGGGGGWSRQQVLEIMIGKKVHQRVLDVIQCVWMGQLLDVIDMKDNLGYSISVQQESDV